MTRMMRPIMNESNIRNYPCLVSFWLQESPHLQVSATTYHIISTYLLSCALIIDNLKFFSITQEPFHTHYIQQSTFSLCLSDPQLVMGVPQDTRDKRLLCHDVRKPTPSPSLDELDDLKFIPDTSSTPPTFSCLPTEIRWQIWTLALPDPRVVSDPSNLGQRDPLDLKPTAFTLSLAHTNRESRDLFLHYYTPTPSFHSPFINFKEDYIDISCLPEKYIGRKEGHGEWSEEDFAKIENVTVHYEADEWTYDQFREDLEWYVRNGVLTGLKNVKVEMHSMSRSRTRNPIGIGLRSIASDFRTLRNNIFPHEKAGKIMTLLKPKFEEILTSISKTFPEWFSRREWKAPKVEVGTCGWCTGCRMIAEQRCVRARMIGMSFDSTTTLLEEEASQLRLCQVVDVDDGDVEVEEKASISSTGVTEEESSGYFLAEDPVERLLSTGRIWVLGHRSGWWGPTRNE
ncbi:hypothetical protein B0J14DRAFT_195922 [Halenospora varia]|nr:hypothetical protein B0J14DRAFT_195922 [Halenospora varia]